MNRTSKEHIHGFDSRLHRYYYRDYWLACYDLCHKPFLFKPHLEAQFTGSFLDPVAGAGATNQAIKAVAIARSYLSEEGVDIVCTPSFIDVSIDDEERTAIRLLVERRA